MSRMTASHNGPALWLHRLGRTMRAAAAMCACLAVPSVSLAQSTIIYVSDLSGRLGTVNVTTGTSTLLGNSGVALTDIAVTSTGTMLGIDFNNLYSVNKTTGSATYIGPLGYGGMNALVGRGGGLVAASRLTTALYAVNAASGASTVLPGSTGFVSSGDLAFHDGYLYASVVNGSFSDLVRITLSGSNFTATNLGKVPGASSLFSLVNGSDGVLYGISGTAVWRIDPSNPASSTIVVADYAANGSGLGPAGGGAAGASINPESAEVPNTAGGTRQIAVTAIAGNSWTAISNVPWITVVAGASGVGGGTVGYAVAANAGTPRIGSLTIAGETFLVTQGSIFSNPAGIAITDGVASLYPSTIAVSGLTGLVQTVAVTLSGLSHLRPSDIDMVLVGPGGQAYEFISDLGGSTPANGLTIRIADDALAPPGSALGNGVFKPSNVGVGDVFPAPGPLSAYSSAAPAGTATFGSTFGGINPNGPWSLYIVDDATGLTGSVTGGWSLSITMNASSGVPDTPSSPQPQDGAAVTSSPTILNWADASGATSYDVYLDGGLRANVVSSQWPLNQTLVPGPHTWSISARNQIGVTQGPLWTFNILATQINFVASRSNGGTTETSGMFLRRVDTPGAPIDPRMKTWVVIHGRTNTSETPEIYDLSQAISAVRNGEQVLVLDWRRGASAVNELLDYRGEDWIKPSGTAAATVLQQYGFVGDKLNLVGHSWGANVADELAETMPPSAQGTGWRVASVVALDPARDALPPAGGLYDAEATGQIDFGLHARCSWAFRSSWAGSSTTPRTADEAFFVALGLPYLATPEAHRIVITLFATMVRDRNGTVSPYSRFFQLERLSQCQRGPWAVNRFNAEGARLVGGGFEGVIYALQGILSVVDFDGSTPTNLRVLSMTGNTVRLGWTLPAVGPPVSAIQLEGGSAPGQVLGSVALPPTTEATLTLPAGALYLRVRALAGGVLTDPSNELLARVGVAALPSAPTNLLGLAQGSALRLSWMNTYAGGAPAQLSLNVSGSLSASVPIGLVDSFTFTSVPPGTYTFSVVATNASGASAPTEPVTLTFPAGCSGAPQTVTNVAAYRIGNTLSVSWEPPSSGAAPTSYVLNVSGSYVGSISTTLRAMSGVVPPGTYNLSVVAVNACGAGTGSPIQAVVVP